MQPENNDLVQRNATQNDATQPKGPQPKAPKPPRRTSPRKAAASRANGALAKGRKTPEGIARSSKNAIRHGLLANTVVLDDESRQHFEELTEQFFCRLSGNDSVESCYIEHMAVSEWQLRRLWAIERTLTNDHTARQPEGPAFDRIAGAFQELTESGSLDLLQRYKTRLERSQSRALQSLHFIRASPHFNAERKSPVTRPTKD